MRPKVQKECVMDKCSRGVCRYGVTLAYDGTDYAGWQIQPSQNTVQNVFQDALRKLGSQDAVAHASGRTDAGVHALGQVVHFDLPRLWETSSLVNALNAHLPDDIRVMGVLDVGPDFHARKCAKGKEYRYFIWNQKTMPPTVRRYHLHVAPKLDAASMKAAAERLVGTHDFAAFSANPSRFVESTVRTIQSLNVEQEDAVFVVQVQGDGFLYKMVRSIVGWLIRVGMGEVTPENTKTVLASCVRTAAVPTAAPQGLFLWNVWYT